MNAQDLLRHVEALGIELAANEPHLKVVAPKGACDEHLKSQLKQYKAELIDLLQERKAREKHRVFSAVVDGKAMTVITKSKGDTLETMKSCLAKQFGKRLTLVVVGYLN